MFRSALAIIAFIASSAHAQRSPDSLAVLSQLVLVDFDRVHSVLVARCEQSPAARASELRAEISRWESSNLEAQLTVRQIQKAQMAAQWRVTTEVADARLRQAAEMFTSGLVQQFNTIPDSQLLGACDGGYAATSLKDLDFQALLEHMRKSPGPGLASR